MTDTPRSTVTADAVQQWILDRLVQQTPLKVDAISIDEPLVSHGLDSVQLISLVGQLEEWLNCRFTSNPFEQYPSIQAISEYVSRELAEGRTQLNPHQN